MFFILPQAWDNEKILNPHEELNLRPLDFHTLMFSISSQSLKLTKHLSYSIYIENCYQYKCASSLKGPMNSEKLSSLYPL